MSGDLFNGMSQREIQGMPMTAEATGVVFSYIFIPRSKRRLVVHPMQTKIALRQERYVRRVCERCPRWRRLKKRKLRSALSRAEVVSNVNLRLLAAPKTPGRVRCGPHARLVRDQPVAASAD